MNAKAIVEQAARRAATKINAECFQGTEFSGEMVQHWANISEREFAWVVQAIQRLEQIATRQSPDGCSLCINAAKGALAAIPKDEKENK